MSDTTTPNLPGWLEGNGVGKKISEERLQSLMTKFTPLIKKDGVLHKFEPPHPRTASFLWSPKFYGAAIAETSFEYLRVVSVDFPCGYYGLFKPSIAEVLAWLPDDEPKINAFYLDSHVDIYKSGEFQRCMVYFGKIAAKDRRGPSPFKKLPEAPPSLKRTDGEMVKFLDGVQGIVDATSNERHNLWEKWHYRPDGRKVSWDSNNSGLMERVGTLDNRPIVITLNTAVVNGKKILFVDPTSQLVDHKMIDKWIADNLPGVSRTDATNFHNVINN
jgi:hypothetical protein